MAKDIDLQEVKKLLDNVTKEVEDSGEDVDEIKDDIESIRKEVFDSGEDVDEIKEDVDDIKDGLESIRKEVEDSGEDVDEIKDELKKLRKEISISSDSKFKSALKRAIPDEFRWDDLAQQIVGAAILSAPFAVTAEVWHLAQKLDVIRIALIILITVMFDVVLFYYTEYQKIENRMVLKFIPLRILALLFVTYTISTVILTIFGVIGGEIMDVGWSARLVILVGLFANIGASTFDILK